MILIFLNGAMIDAMKSIFSLLFCKSISTAELFITRGMKIWRVRMFIVRKYDHRHRTSMRPCCGFWHPAPT